MTGSGPLDYVPTMTIRPVLGIAVLAAASLTTGCASTTNLLSANQPRFLGSYAPASVHSRAPLRVVTFPRLM